ncbi:MAG: cyanoexosortase A [Snowella sp.]|nr:cyanoexosortase A [Snowella sp.]
MNIDVFFNHWKGRGQNFQKTPFLLALLGISLIIVHLSMIWRVNALNFWGLSLIFWCAVASSIWDKRQGLKLESDFFSTHFAIALLIPLLIKSVFLITHSTSSLYLFPIGASVCLALLASGFRGLFQYKREFLIILILCAIAPITALLTRFDPSPLTAKLASYLLWYAGFSFVRQGVNIYFQGSTSGIEVYPGCSGLNTMIEMLSLTLLFFLMFPTRWKTKVILPLGAVAIGFVMNALRVALLGVIVAYHNRVGFDYWHAGEGSLVFSLISMSLLCALAYFLSQFWDTTTFSTQQEDYE